MSATTTPRPPLRALVLDDEWPARSYLVELLQETGRVEVVAAVAGVAEAEQVLAAPGLVPLDVAFVDVQLVGRPGNEAGLAWVRERTGRAHAPAFVLATAFKEHAPEAFDLGVADYLVKPFTDERIATCVERLVQRRPAAPAPPAVTRVVARRERSLVFLAFDEVWACEAEERLTYVHAARGRLELDLTLSAIAASFGRGLVRVHRGWLVNLARVMELERGDGETTLIVGGSDGGSVRVPVSRDRASEVRELLLAGATGVRR